ncbi:UNVERIFIED_CONTAM: CubicO group peptidase (beta-lactamase class C family) [Acetivibrio alkalicellulosi]
MRRTKLNKLALLIIVVTLISSMACSNQKKEEFSEDVIEKIDSILETYDFKGTFLVEKGNKQYIKSIGEYSKDDIKYPIASITKTFTAVAIMKLYEEGKLDIEDKLSKYIPDIKHSDSITISHLLSHQSGIPRDIFNVNIDPFIKDDTLQNPQEFIEWFQSLDIEEEIEYLKWLNEKFNHYSEIHDIIINSDFQLLFEPGEQFSYSNAGYSILGKIIEEASQMSYLDYLNKVIFKPLNMKNTWFFEEESGNYSRPLSDKYDNEEYFKDLRINASNLSYSGGALFSTVEDMLKFSQVFTTEKILKKETIKKMCFPHKYNFGLGIITYPRDYIGHDGEYYDEFISKLRINTDEDIKLIYFADTSVNEIFRFDERVHFQIYAAIKKE